MPLAEVLRPAIALARDGFPADWTTTLQVALDAATLRRYESAASLFMPGGLPIVPAATPQPHLLKQPDLARTLEALAAEGPDAFYRGAVARRIVEDVRSHGGILEEEDFARYEARVAPALVSRALGYDVMLSSGPSGGATLAEIAGLMAGSPLGRLGHNTAPYLHLLIEATHAAFDDRLRLLSDEGGWDALTSDAHISTRRAGIGERAAAPAGAGGRAGADPTSTTHLCAADASGKMVSLTQTLLSRFGSRVLVPGAGVLLNNGMMWFEPEPGHRNSAAPRMDASSDEVIVDARIPAAVRDDLARRGHRIVAAEEAMAPRFFASPVAVARDPSTGALTGGADPYHPAAAVGA